MLIYLNTDLYGYILNIWVIEYITHIKKQYVKIKITAYSSNNFYLKIM